MKHVLKNINYFNKQIIHEKIFNHLNISQEHFLYFFDIINNTINYVVYSTEILFIQIIFQEKKWSTNTNFNILEKGIEYLSSNNLEIDKIIQYNMLMYDNNSDFEIKKWKFKSLSNEFNNDFYLVYIYNLNKIKKTKDKNLQFLFKLLMNL